MLNKIKYFLCTFLVSLGAQAQVTIPNTFTSGSSVSSSQMNANFGAVATAINNLAARVSKLEGVITAADIVGTYTVSGLQVELNQNHIAHYTYAGTAVFAANGNFTLTTTATGQQYNTLSETATVFSGSGGNTSTDTSTWALIGSTVSIGGVFNYKVADAGKLLILANSSIVAPTPSEPQSSVLLMFTRQ